MLACQGLSACLAQGTQFVSDANALLACQVALKRDWRRLSGDALVRIAEAAVAAAAAAIGGAS